MTRIIAISNQKGGTGKTITAVNLAHALARSGQRVLLVDFDSQGSAALALGFDPSPATYRLIMQGQALPDLVVTARPGLDLLPSDTSLADVRDFLGVKSTRGGKDALQALASALQDHLHIYDYVLIDCAPGLDLLTLNVLMVAGEILIPVSMDFLSAAGVNQYLQTVDDMQVAGSKAELRYVVPTRYDGRLNRVQKILAILQRTFGDLVTTPIRNNTRLGEAPHYGQTIFEHDPAALGAADYSALCERVKADE